MQIRIRQSGQVMYEEAFRQHIQQNGGPSWGQTTTEILNELGADVVFDGPQPTLTPPYQVAVPNGVVQENGQWYTSFVAGPVFTDTTEDGVTTTAAQHQAAYQAQMDATQATSVRSQRDDKLTACDWTQAPDNPMASATKTAWATYRQALRDLTKETGFPWTFDWPTDPNGAK